MPQKSTYSLTLRRNWFGICIVKYPLPQFLRGKYTVVLLVYMYFVGYTLHFNPFRLKLYSAKFGTYSVVSVNGTLVEDIMHTFKSECALFSFSMCTIYTHYGASAKFFTN